MEKLPNLKKYDGKEDSDEHIQFFNDRLNYFNIDEASKWKLFALAMVIPDRLSFNGLPDGNIESWMYSCEWFSTHFISRKRKPVMVATLSTIV